MRELTEAGRAVVDAPAAPPTPLDEIEERASRRRRHGRARTALAVATSAALVAGAIVVAYDRQSTTTPEARRGDGERATVSVRLSAHRGADVPTGWKPVDYGLARVWVPATWAVEPGRCPGRQPGWVQLGGPYKMQCRAPKLQTTVTITRGRPSTTGAARQDINGYDVYRGDESWIVPELGVVIDARGPDAERVLATLAPSSRAVATSFPAQPPPADWHRVSYDGISLAVPREWPISRGQCVPIAAESLSAGFDASADCPYIPAPDTAFDGAAIDTWSVYGKQPSHVVGGQWPADMQIRALEEDLRDPKPILELSIAVGRDQDTPIRLHRVLIGLGRDGLVANRIMHSITRNTSVGLAVRGCAIQPSRPAASPARLEKSIIPDQPERAVLCAYATSPYRGAALIGAHEVDATSTAGALNQTSTDPTAACDYWPGPFGTLRFLYADGVSREVTVTACQTASGRGFVPTPPFLWESVVQLAY